jgi:SAM-dependent methyltransferase
MIAAGGNLKGGVSCLSAEPQDALEWILGHMACPFCRGGFSLDLAGRDSWGGRFGSLSCHCGRFPLVADIPVIMPRYDGRETAFQAGLLRLVDDGRFDDLTRYLVLDARRAGGVFGRNDGRGEAVCRNLFRFTRWELARRRRLRSVEARLAGLRAPARESFTGYLDLYYNWPGYRSQVFEYFAYRFSQPRHLVALSLLRLVEERQGPVLDLASGCGVVARGIVRRAGDRKVIGTDRQLFPLLVAKRFVAPEAAFVCCDANYPLPFRDRLFPTISCFDGIHYVENKNGFLAEVERVADDADRCAIFGSTRNADVPYAYGGFPLSAGAYRNLLGSADYRMTSDKAILNAYLSGGGPDLSGSPSPSSIAGESLISIVLSNNERTWRDYGPFEAWPHGVGRLDVNPLYRIEPGRDESRRLLVRDYPSGFFQSDHAESKQYLPECVEIDSAEMRLIESGERGPAVERLIGSFVVLDLPERYRC